MEERGRGESVQWEEYVKEERGRNRFIESRGFQVGVPEFLQKLFYQPSSSLPKIPASSDLCVSRRGVRCTYFNVSQP